MTTQDIEKLKAFCDEKGIEMIPTADRDVWEFKSKDIWDGVEYAECVQSYKSSTSDAEIVKGQIYKIESWFKREVIYLPGFELGWQTYKFKPSTESAYVEQLKAKAKELYGEIKDGDRFWIDENLGEVSMYDCEDGFSYWKEDDLLYFGNYAIYSKGKWAKRVEEPIKANITSFTLSNPYSTIVFTTSHRIKDGQVDVKEFMNHIEESIEAFLNRKP